MAVIGARLMFQAGSRTIAGSLGGRFLHCTMRPAQGGALPPAGDYEILPPMNDPIYGRVALMVPVGVAGAIRTGLTMEKAVQSSVAFLKPDVTPTAKGQKDYEKPMAARRMGHPPGAAGGQAFVLSDRPVLGRNSIVVSSGFADLMDALQTSGGARVTVA